MEFNKNFLLDIVLSPKKALTSRKLHITLLVSFLVGGLVYLKQHSVQKQSIQQKIAEIKNLGSDYSQVINELQSHIESLTSRVKYLSIDNKRLSSTGQKLSEQLNENHERIDKKLSETRNLQLELAELDLLMIHTYDGFIEKQQTYSKLIMECTKNKSKSKNCVNYALTKDQLQAMQLELKALKNKRVVLLSQMTRFNKNL